MRKKEIVRNVLYNKGIVSGPDYRDLGAILLFIFLLPYIISFFFGNTGGAGAGTEAEAAAQGMEKTVQEEGSRTETEWLEEDFHSAQFIVCSQTAAGIGKMPLETYLAARLPATIDMEYEEEALKAQTVVLRTELMRIYRDEKDGKGADGKAYIFVENSPLSADGESYEKARAAVESTRGMYLTWEGEPVNAPYFAVSAGATRNGNEVFCSADYGYLKSVMCERDFTSGDYMESVQMSKPAFFERLEEICPGIASDGENNCGELDISRDRAGYVTEIGRGDKYIAGETFRSEFLLNSSCFELEEEGDTVRIKTKGVGHGLGLCQYGANEAAKKGSDFIDILNYFFSGVVIEKTE